MKKCFLFLSFLVSVDVSAQTPSFQWVNRVGGANDEQGNSIKVDGSGNVYSIGSFMGTADFDPGSGIYNLTSAGANDIFISKLDASGNFVWALRIGGSTNDYGKSIAVDLSGNIFITGEFYNIVDFDPSGGVYNLSSSGANDIFVSKFDPSGNFQWAKNIGGASIDAGYSIAIDSINNIYTTGYFYNTVDFNPGLGIYNLTSAGDQDIFVSKLDGSGNFIWAKQMGGVGSEVANSIAVDRFGNIYTTGNYYGISDFDPGVGVYNDTSVGGTVDIFISKLNSYGDFVWEKGMGGGSTFSIDIGNSITVDDASNVYTTGHFTGTVDFDPDADSVYWLPGSVADDAFVSKLDSLGNFVWAAQLAGGGNEMGTSIAVDKNGYVYTTGVFSGSTDFDPGVGGYVLTSSAPDIFISKLDSLGGFAWAKQIGSSGGDVGNAMTIDTSGNLYLIGNFMGMVDFNIGLGVNNLSSAGSSDVFILKMDNTDDIWPGDVNNNHIVDNTDLLPIGLYYGQTGTPRTTISNTWQAYSSTDWGILLSGGADIKHVDCNGDGTIDNNDTLAVNLNFALTHAFAPIDNDVRLPAADLYFVTSSSSYLSGSLVDVEVWAGNSATPVTNLYGIAFDINYDVSLVQPSSESLTYPVSWLGAPGTDAITLGKVDAFGSTAYGAETRINQINSSGFGKIANFKFQLKSSIPANTVMSFSISGYQANNASGTPVLFNTPLDSIIINPTSVGLSEINSGLQISVYPNPSNGTFNIFTSEQIKNGSLEIYNSIGELIISQKIINQQNLIDLKNQASGLYFLKVKSDGEVVGMKKVVKQ